MCGAQARLHDRRPTWVRDLPAGDRAVKLVWVKRIRPERIRPARRLHVVLRLARGLTM
ncbi:hypothetical protein [Mycobacterium sp.]|uniref:hypothetical protein n=1 Tax=Mycobacterium sp. TaxID=1785 RepID=UPI003F94A129